MSAYNAAMSADIPVVYTAVSDPVGQDLQKRMAATQETSQVPVTFFR